MDGKKRKQLTEAGWRVGDASSFLELTPEEREVVEIKLELHQYLREQGEEE
jgi:hypothetical protein